MRERIVTILLRVNNGRGKHPYYPAVVGSNGILKPFYARIAGHPVLRKDGVYYLRYTDRHGKRCYQYVGTDPDLARTLRYHREHIIAGEKMGIFGAEAPSPVRPPRPVALTPESVAHLVPPEAPQPGEAGKRLPLAGTVDKFVREMDVVRSRKRANEYRHKLGAFVKVFEKTYLDEVEDDDIVRFIAAIRRQNLSTRTIANYCLTLRAFFRRYGLTGKVPNRLIPRATDKVVQAYRQAELKALFAAADPEERILFQFFLGLGMREQEVMYAAWPDIDFERAVFHIQDKPDSGFVIKDKEERFIPIPTLLLASLKERFQKQKHRRWIFPTERGRPDGHFLRRLQKLALRGRINCGQCCTKGGQSCQDTACCRQFGLHKFRRTYATLHHETGVPIRTLMAWLGHSDLETTIRYLAAADPGSQRTRALVDQSWAAFA